MSVFFSPFAIFAVVSVTLANLIQLMAHDVGDPHFFAYLRDVDEGDGIKYFCLADIGVGFIHQNDTIFNIDAPEARFRLGFHDDFLAFGDNLHPEHFFFNNDGSLVTGDRFWACRNVKDPYKHSKHRVLIKRSPKRPNWRCWEVKILLRLIFETLTLQAEGIDEINGNWDLGGLTAYEDHEECMYFAVTQGWGTPLYYRLGRMYKTDSPLSADVGIDNDFLAIKRDIPSLLMRPRGDYIDPGKRVWACNDVFDTKHLSKRLKMIIVHDWCPNHTCIEVRLKYTEMAGNTEIKHGNLN